MKKILQYFKNRNNSRQADLQAQNESQEHSGEQSNETEKHNVNEYNENDGSSQKGVNEYETTTYNDDHTEEEKIPSPEDTDTGKTEERNTPSSGENSQNTSVDSQLFTTETTHKEGKDTIVITLGSDISIQKDLGELQAAISDAIQNAQQVVITSGGEVNGDIALIQLLQAAVQKAHENTVEITFAFDLADDYRQLLDKAGLLHIIKN